MDIPAIRPVDSRIDPGPSGNSPVGPQKQTKTHVRPPAFIFVMGTVALAGFVITRSWTGASAPALWFWIGACLVGELLWVRLPLGRVTVSMASCSNFAALIALPRDQAMLACAVSAVVAETVFVRKPLIRAVFNGCQASLAVGAASWVLAALSGKASPGTPFADFGLVALAAAGATYFVINSGFVSVAVALHERIPLAWSWRANFGTRYEVLSNGALFSLGALLASAAALHGIRGTSLVILPLLVAFHGYRWHARSRVAEDESHQVKAA